MWQKESSEHSRTGTCRHADFSQLGMQLTMIKCMTPDGWVTNAYKVFGFYERWRISDVELCTLYLPSHGYEWITKWLESTCLNASETMLIFELIDLFVVQCDYNNLRTIFFISYNLNRDEVFYVLTNSGYLRVIVARCGGRGVRPGGLLVLPGASRRQPLGVAHAVVQRGAQRSAWCDARFSL